MPYCCGVSITFSCGPPGTEEMSDPRSLTWLLLLTSLLFAQDACDDVSGHRMEERNIVSYLSYYFTLNINYIKSRRASLRLRLPYVMVSLLPKFEVLGFANLCLKSLNDLLADGGGCLRRRFKNCANPPSSTEPPATQMMRAWKRSAMNKLVNVNSKSPRTRHAAARKGFFFLINIIIM